MWGGPVVTIIETKCTVSVTRWNHWEAGPRPHGKMVFHETGPCCQQRLRTATEHSFLPFFPSFIKDTHINTLSTCNRKGDTCVLLSGSMWFKAKAKEVLTISVMNGVFGDISGALGSHDRHTLHILGAGLKCEQSHRQRVLLGKGAEWGSSSPLRQVQMSVSRG